MISPVNNNFSPAILAAESEKFMRAVGQAKKILVISHTNPDGDTLGSALAFIHYLEDKKIENFHFCSTEPASYFIYLPKIKDLSTDLDPKTIDGFDLIILFDHGAIHQSQIETHLTPLLTRPDITIANIDHHISNSKFGNINIVNLEASSTCEALYYLLMAAGIEINSSMATCLMTGIITDTSNFTNSATQHSSLTAAADLAQRGAKIPEISAHVFRNKNIPSLNLWGTVLNRLYIDEAEGMAFTVITQNDFETYGIEREALDGLINFLSHLENVRYVKMLVEEKDGSIKGSLRTSRDDIDLTVMAAQWGGGGHRKAAGFKLKGRLVEVDEKWMVVESE